MKIVREHINEKFTANSDPIADMSIGLGSYFDNICKNIMKADQEEEELIWTIEYENIFPYLRVWLNMPKMTNYRHLQTNNAIKQYLKNILVDKLHYNKIFKKIVLFGRFVKYSHGLLSVPMIYVLINENIKINFKHIRIQRRRDSTTKLNIQIEKS